MGGETRARPRQPGAHTPAAARSTRPAFATAARTGRDRPARGAAPPPASAAARLLVGGAARNGRRRPAARLAGLGAVSWAVAQRTPGRFGRPAAWRTGRPVRCLLGAVPPSQRREAATSRSVSAADVEGGG